jgi:uncharacterized protein YbjQ (UPF0145 family)
MLTSTSPEINGKKVTEHLGLVKGNTIRARWFGRDIAASLKHVIGGEIKSYTRLLNDAREEALNRMLEQAEKKGANAVISIRFTTSTLLGGAAEILAFGTAVKVK